MTEKNKCRAIAGIVYAVGLGLILAEFAGCKAREKIFTIGIVSEVSLNAEVLEGFKQGMIELGYIEGKNLMYINKSVKMLDKQDIEAGIKEVLSQDIDILLTLGRSVPIGAKELVKGTDMPVLFCGDAWPVEDGLVESLIHPGGNIVGVRAAESLPKALEWLVKIVPGAIKIWVPYNPDDNVSVSDIRHLEKAASPLGVEFVLHETRSVEEAVAAIGDLPKDIDAIFLVPSPTLNPGSEKLSQAAISRGIPVGASIRLDESILITLTSDFIDAGKKAARLAQRIHEDGIKPADLPVETSEVRLIINVKTAEEIGIVIPDNILGQATTIIR